MSQCNDGLCIKQQLSNIWHSIHEKVKEQWGWVVLLLIHQIYYRSSHRNCSVRKDVLRNFAKFTEKHLCQSLFYNKVAGLRPAFLLKKTPTQVFSCEFFKISKNTIFTEHFWTTVSDTNGCTRKDLTKMKWWLIFASL